MSIPHEPLSPELVLVSDELGAARARALLPDRPWEAFVPAPTVLVRRPASRDALVVPPASPQATDVVWQPTELVRGGRTSRPARVPGLVLGVVVLLLVGAVLASEARPPESTFTPVPIEPASDPIKPIKPSPTVEPPQARSLPRVVRPIPSGGYSFGAAGRLFIARDARSIAWLEISSRCLGKLRLEGLRLSSAGTFVVRREWGPKKSRRHVVLHGRFLTETKVSVRISARRPHCKETPVRVTGRLS